MSDNGIFSEFSGIYDSCRKKILSLKGYRNLLKLNTNVVYDIYYILLYTSLYYTLHILLSTGFCTGFCQDRNEICTGFSLNFVLDY